MAANVVPPLPEGFKLDQSSSTPPLPDGFTLDSEQPKQSSGVPDDLYDANDEMSKKALRIGREVVRLFGQGAASLAGAPLAPELQPQNASERIGTGIDRMLGSVGTGIGAGRAMAQSAGPVVSQVGQVLQSNPGMQVAGAVTGPAASEAARAAGAGDTGQTIAEVIGSAAPGVLGASSVAATRGAFRGGEAGRQQVADNIQSFSRAGTSPSVGQATENRVARAAESGLAIAPGAAGKMNEKAASQAGELGANIERRAAQLIGKKTSAEQTGRKIQQGITGEGGFVERFKDQQKAFYGAVDAQIKPDSVVDVTRTRKALSDLNAAIPNAPELSKFFQNAKILGIEKALVSDAGPSTTASQFTGGKAPQTLPYAALSKLRTLVGQEMADAGPLSDVPRSKWKALYGALSSDMEVAANQSGPAATSAWSRANNFTRAGMRRLDTVDHVIDKNGGPEKVFTSAMSGTKEGATTLRAVMQSLDDDGKRTLSATVLRRLGVAKAGAQNEVGDQFSTETFLTNWNGLSKEAKATLFDRYGPTFRGDIDAIAKTASNLRDGSQVFRNPSGTAQKTALFTVMSALGGAVGTGNLPAAGGIVAGVGSANLSARLMTNPRFVRWLASTTKAPTGAYTSAVNALAANARQSSDLDIAKAVALLEQSKEYKGDQQQRNAQDK